MKIRILLALPILLLLCASVHGQIVATGCTQPEVQAAFSAVVAGTTTVTIPACSAGVGWSAQAVLTIPGGNTSLTITGAGSLTTTGGGDQTVFIDNFNSSTPLIVINTNSNTAAFVRLAGITVKGGAAGVNPKFDGVISFFGSSQNVRVDHIHINVTTYTGSSNGSGLEFQGCLSGVTDHSIFDGGTGSVSNMVRLYNGGTCNSDALGLGDQSWTQTTGFGTANFMFVETNVFNGGAGNDCTKGGRYVWRFNTMNMTTPAPTTQTHPTGGGMRERGCRAVENYKNTATAISGNYINAYMWISSGTMLIWGNTTPSSSAGGGTGYRNLIAAHNMRSDNSTYTQSPTPGGWGYCGTAFNGTGSGWDQNSNAGTGYACIDQVGRGVGQLLVNDFPNVLNNVTGTLAWPNQALEPVYEWANVYSPVPSNPSTIWSQSGPDDTENIDYYRGTLDSGSAITFNGSLACATAPHCGVGVGTLASRPATCTTGVAYFATDQGSWNSSSSGGQGLLYKCISTNTWTLFYTPYAYPHPLVNGGTAAPAVSFNPQPVNFGNQNVGTSSNLSVTVTNSGTANQVLSAAATVSGTDLSLVSTTCTNGLSLAPNGTCSVTIKCAPTSAVLRSGTLNINGTVSATDAISCNGTNAISIPAAPTGVSATPVGSTITVSWTASTGTPTGYNVLRGTINGGPYSVIATVGLVTSYSDSNLANGTYYYVVNAFNTAGTSPNSSQASATVSAVCGINLSPPSFNFGSVTQGTTATANQSVTVSNVGTATCTGVTVANPSGPNGADFGQNNTCSGTLIVHGQCFITPSFTPSTTTLEQASIVVTSSDPGSPDTVTLTGTGSSPVVLSPPTITIANTYTSKTSATAVLNYTNQTGTTITISSDVFSGGDATQFSVSDNCGGSVLSGVTCQFSITLTPTSNGNKTTNFVITDSAAGSPRTIAVSGRATGHVVKIGVVL